MSTVNLNAKGYNPDYKDPQYIRPHDNKPKILWYWQPEAFDKLKDVTFACICAFCGSGKSILQVALAVHDVVRSGYTQKQLAVVPESHIHRGFVGDGDADFIRIIVEGKEYEWVVKDNFCDENSKQVLVGLKKWLLASPKALSKNCTDKIITGVNAVASHQALSAVFNKMTNKERRKAITNLTLRFDEFHHASGIFCDEDTAYLPEELRAMELESTTMGSICRFIMNNQDCDSKICGATATLYRGDRGVILSHAVVDQFTFYYLDWVEHFKTLGIRDFTIQYEEYKRDPIRQVINKIKANPEDKHMIVVPSTTHKWRKNGKDEVDELFSKLYKIYPKERVLDLVTQKTQKKNKALLLKEPKSEHDGESKYDVVVTCMLGREGTDWCPCSMLHNTSTENSVTLAIQTIGRPFRRFKGKEHVLVYHYIPEFVKPKKGVTKAEFLEDRTNALLVCMQMDEMSHPIILPVIPLPKSKDPKKKGEKQETISLADIFGDQYVNVKDSLIEGIESLEDKTAKNIDAVIEEILEGHDVPKEMLRAVKDALRVHTLRVLSPQLKDLGIDIKFMRKAGFSKLVEKYDIESKSIFFEGNYSVKDWDMIREILKENWEDWVEEAKRATEEGRWSVRK